MDRFIKIDSLCDFIDRLFEFVNESKAWEYWLYRETAMSWENFRLATIPQEADLNKMESVRSDIEKALWEGVIANGTV